MNNKFLTQFTQVATLVATGALLLAGCDKPESPKIEDSSTPMADTAPANNEMMAETTQEPTLQVQISDVAETQTSDGVETKVIEETKSEVMKAEESEQSEIMETMPLEPQTEKTNIEQEQTQSEGLSQFSESKTDKQQNSESVLEILKRQYEQVRCPTEDSQGFCREEEQRILQQIEQLESQQKLELTLAALQQQYEQFSCEDNTEVGFCSAEKYRMQTEIEQIQQRLNQ